MDSFETIITLLEDGKADVNKPRLSDNATPLYIACTEGHVEAVKVLLEHKAEVNLEIPKDGSTPLYVASQNNHPLVVKLLIDAGGRKLT